MRDVKSVFGVSTITIKNQSKRYNLGLLLGVVLDVVIMALLIIRVITQPQGEISQAPAYIIVCVVAALISNFLIANIIKNDIKEAYIFYRRNKKYKTEVRKYAVDSNKLFSVLFCSGYQRVKPDCTLDVYKEGLNNACCQNNKYSKKIMNYLSKYESDDGNLEVVVMKKGKSIYYIDSL